MAKDYYRILGVGKSASADEIKRAYRKLAHEHHPDKTDHKDDAKFKEINEAYQVLGNAQKRAQYDQFGTADFAGAGGFGGFDGFRNQGFNGQGFDFSGFGFGGGLGDIFEGIFSQAFSQVQTEISITLTQAILGGRIDLKTSNNDLITLNIPPGTPDGTTFQFRGKGGQHRRGRGDLLVTVRVQLPRRLSREQKELFERLRQSGLWYLILTIFVIR